MQDQVFRDVLFSPIILREIVLKDELRVIGIAEEVRLRDGLYFVVEELEGVLIGELHDVVLECTDVFKQLGGILRVQGNITVFELMEWGIVVFVDRDELLL